MQKPKRPFSGMDSAKLWKVMASTVGNVRLKPNIQGHEISFRKPFANLQNIQELPPKLDSSWFEEIPPDNKPQAPLKLSPVTQVPPEVQVSCILVDPTQLPEKNIQSCPPLVAVPDIVAPTIIADSLKRARRKSCLPQKQPRARPERRRESIPKISRVSALGLMPTTPSTPLHTFISSINVYPDSSSTPQPLSSLELKRRRASIFQMKKVRKPPIEESTDPFQIPLSHEAVTSISSATTLEQSETSSTTSTSTPQSTSSIQSPLAACDDFIDRLQIVVRDTSSFQNTASCSSTTDNPAFSEEQETPSQTTPYESAEIVLIQTVQLEKRLKGTAKRRLYIAASDRVTRSTHSRSPEPLDARKSGEEVSDVIEREADGKTNGTESNSVTEIGTKLESQPSDGATMENNMQPEENLDAKTEQIDISGTAITSSCDNQPHFLPGLTPPNEHGEVAGEPQVNLEVINNVVNVEQANPAVKVKRLRRPSIPFDMRQAPSTKSRLPRKPAAQETPPKHPTSPASSPRTSVYSPGKLAMQTLLLQQSEIAKANPNMVIYPSPTTQYERFSNACLMGLYASNHAVFARKGKQECHDYAKQEWSLLKSQVGTGFFFIAETYIRTQESAFQALNSCASTSSSTGAPQSLAHFSPTQLPHRPPRGRRPPRNLSSLLDSPEASIEHRPSRASVISEYPVYCICRKPAGASPMLRCERCKEWFHFRCVGTTKKQAEAWTTYVCHECDPKFQTSTDHEEYEEQLNWFDFNVVTGQKVKPILKQTGSPNPKTVQFCPRVSERLFNRQQMGSSGVPSVGSYSLGLSWELIAQSEGCLNDEQTTDQQDIVCLAAFGPVRVPRRHPCSKVSELLPRLQEEERKKLLDDCELSSTEIVELDELRASRLGQFCQCASLGMLCGDNPTCPCNADGVQCHVELGTAFCQCGSRCANPNGVYRFNATRARTERLRAILRDNPKDGRSRSNGNLTAPEVTMVGCIGNPTTAPVCAPNVEVPETIGPRSMSAPPKLSIPP